MATVTDIALVWDPALLDYDLGDHPLDPVRVELAIALARSLGVLDRPNVTVVDAPPASDEDLCRVHDPAYLAAVRAATEDPYYFGYGMGTADNPVFPDMHEASAKVAGATLAAAQMVWDGTAKRAISIAGGLHHAMRDRAAGFCVYNDPAVAIAQLLDRGAERIGYVDVDVHHGDGVQAAFYDDPRVLTVSIHESPLSLFPGTGFPTEVGGERALGSAVNVALPPGTGDEGWLRAFHAVVPGVLRAFQPQLLVTQCGADTHRLDPLADLRLSVDGQRAGYLVLRDLAEELCDGRWVATGGGGYALVEVVPRAWAHLIAIVAGEQVSPATPTPPDWRAFVRQRRPDATPPYRMGDLDSAAHPPHHRPWQPGRSADGVDRAIAATRRAVYPLHGLDPDDPRD